MKFIKSILIYALFIFSIVGYGQNKYKNADKSFESLWYIQAAQQYESHINKGDTSQEVLQKIGDAYYFNTDMVNANKWYSLLFSKYENTLTPKYAFRYIHSLEGIGNYTLAKGLMKIYGEKLKDRGFKVDQLKENDATLDKILTKQPEFYISHLDMNTKVADFGAAYYKDKIVFASSRDSIDLQTRIYKWNEQPFLNLYVADTIEGGTELKNVELLSDKINTKYHEAAVAFNKEGTIMYFTRNNYTNKKLRRDDDGFNNLKLYRVALNNDEWGAITEVPFNSDAYSVGQPALSDDGKKLYFVSDMPGTMGATDIFVADISEDGSYSTPKNLGPAINTSGREMFPFVTGKQMYFASDGHLGLGGLDIFESEFENGYSEPNNLGSPVNSKLDDFAYIVNPDNRRGYFSSNREGGTGDDDIYSFERIEVTTICSQLVSGTVVNEANGMPMANAEVTLLDEVETTLAVSTTNSQGEYSFNEMIACDTPYTIKVEKNGYDSTTELFTSTNVNEFQNKIALGIKKRNNLIVQENGVFKIKIGYIHFDYDKALITNDASIELNKIVLLMREYPNMVIKIESHTDARGNDAYNQNLSNDRALATKEYLISQDIEPNRIESAIGYGETMLVNECKNGVPCSDVKHNKNRRSEFIITQLE